MQEEQRKKLSKLISNKKSGWLEEAQYDQANRNWLKHSQRIALKVLCALKEQKVSQVELAKRIGVTPQQVNKLVKGSENMTLETISKLEQALGIELIGQKVDSMVYLENFEEVTQMMDVPVHAIRVQHDVIFPVVENLSNSIQGMITTGDLNLNDTRPVPSFDDFISFTTMNEPYSYAMEA